MPSSERLLGSHIHTVLQPRGCSVHSRTHEHNDRYLRLCFAYEDGVEDTIAETPKNRTIGHLWSRFLVSGSLYTQAYH